MLTDITDRAPMAKPRSPNATYNPLTVEFGRRLQHFIAERGWTQAEFSREASKFLPKNKKLRRDNISLYCRGAQMPSELRIIAMVKALKITREELVPEPATEGAPPFAMKPMEGENVWLQVNQVVSLPMALEIAALLSKRKDGK
jgi:transcriptional regulator with XRE-family HTH domain